MKILVVGSGGREHALVWKLKQSPTVRDIFVAPGNAGTGQIAENLPLITTDEIVEWLKKNKADLVVVGPDSYLEEGIVDKIKESKAATTDTRHLYTGKNCLQGWKKGEIILLFLRLKIPFDVDTEIKDKEEMADLISRKKVKLPEGEITVKKLQAIYTLSKMDMRTLCEILQAWFTEKNLIIRE